MAACLSKEDSETDAAALLAGRTDRRLFDKTGTELERPMRHETWPFQFV
jgi:hypothetical protein